MLRSSTDTCGGISTHLVGIGVRVTVGLGLGLGLGRRVRVRARARATVRGFGLRLGLRLGLGSGSGSLGLGLPATACARRAARSTPRLNAGRCAYWSRCAARPHDQVPVQRELRAYLGRCVVQVVSIKVAVVVFSSSCSSIGHKYSTQEVL